MADINKLYNTLTDPNKEYKDKYFTVVPSFKNFSNKMQNPEYQATVHDIIANKEKIYSSDLTQFKKDFVFTPGDFVSQDGDLIIKKSENAQDFAKNLINIDKSVTWENNSKFKNAVFSEYFDLSDFYRPVAIDTRNAPVTFTGVDRPTQGMSSVITVQGKDPAQVGAIPSMEKLQSKQGEGEVLYKNTLEEDLIKKFGNKKYQLYKKYLETGDLKLEDVPYDLQYDSNNEITPGGFKEVLEKNRRIEQNRLTQEYVRDHDPSSPKGAREVLRTIEELLDIDEEDDFYTRDFSTDYKKYEDAAEYLTSDKYYENVLMNPDKFLLNPYEQRKDVAEGAIKAQSEYIQAVQDNLVKDLDSFNKSLDTDYGIKNVEDLDAFLQNQNIDVEVRRSVLKSNNEIAGRIKKLQNNAIKLNDKVSALKALNMNYDWGYGVSLALEKSIFGAGGTALMGLSSKTVQLIAGDDAKATDFMIKKYNNHINYTESLNKKIETTVPMAIKFDEVGNLKDFSRFLSDNFRDNAFTIATSLSYVGWAKAIGKKKAKKVIGATYLNVEGGEKLSYMEIQQKNAGEMISFLEGQKNNPNITPDVLLKINEEIDNQESALNFTQSQRLFSASTYGLMANYAERLGTLAWLDDLNKISKLYGPVTMGALVKGVGNFVVKGPVTEIAEEGFTLMGHNFIDNAILGEDKDLTEGIDGNFIANVAATTLAIGGPSIAQNIRNTYRSAVMTREERVEMEGLLKEWTENQSILLDNEIGISKKEAKILKKRQKEIQNGLSILDTKVLNKLGDLNEQDTKKVFDLVRRQRVLYKRMMALGAVSDKETDSSKKLRNSLNKQYNDLQSEKETLLKSPVSKAEQKLREDGKKLNIEENKAMSHANALGQHMYFNNLMKGMGNNVVAFDGDNALQELDEYLVKKVNDGVITEKEKKQILDNYKTVSTGGIGLAAQQNMLKVGGFGTYVGNDLLVFSNNVRLGLLTDNEVVKADAIRVAVHEYQHRYDIKSGLVKDGKVVASHEKFVLETIKYLEQELKNNPKLLKQVMGRINQYVDIQNLSLTNKKGIDTAELLTLLGTLRGMGVFKSPKNSILYSFKSFLNKIRALKDGENYTLLQINSTQDVLRYIDSFVKKTQQPGAKAQLPPEEEQKEIKEARGTLIEDIDKMAKGATTQAEFRDPKVFNPIYKSVVQPGGAINNYVKSLGFSPEKTQATLDEIADRLLNYNPETKKAFGEFIMSNVGFAEKVARKELAIKAEKTKREKRIQQPTKEGDIVEDIEDTQELTPEEQMIQQEEMSYEDYTAEVSRIIEKIVVLKGDSYGDFKEKIKEGVRKTLGTKLPSIENNRKYKLTLQKAYELEFKNLLQEYFDVEKNYNNFVKKYFPVIFNSNVLTKEDLIQIERLQKVKIFATKKRITKPTEVDKLVEKGLLPKTVNRNSGPNLITKLKLSMVEDKNGETAYMRFFNPPTINPKTGKKSGLRGTRKDKLAERVVSKLAYAATMEVQSEQDVRDRMRAISKLQGQQLFENDTERLANILDVDPKVKMSLGTELTGPNLILQVNYLVDAIENNENFYDVIDVEKRKAKINIMGREIDQVVVDHIIEGYEDGLVNPKELKFKIGKKLHTVGHGKFSKSYEESGIKNVIVQSEKLPFVTVLYEDVKESNVEILNSEGKKIIVPNPDVTIVLFKDTPLETHIPIEYKAGNARASHNGASYANFKTGEIVRKEKLDKKHEKKIKEALKKVVDKVKAIRKRIKKEIGVDLVDSDTVLTQDQYDKLKALGLKALTNDYSVKVGGDFISNNYNVKGVHYIQAGGIGGFIMGQDVFEMAELGMSPLEGEFVLIARLNPARVTKEINGKKVKVGYRLRVDTEPQFKTNSIKSKTNFSFDNSNSISSILNTSFFQAKVKAYNQILSNAKQSKVISDAVVNSRSVFKENFDKFQAQKQKGKEFVESILKESKGITILDFDDTLATTKSLVKFTAPDGTTGTLNAEQYANTYEDLLDQGYTFDFSDFNKVVKGKLAPLFNKAMKLQGKFGPENMFVLTARPSAAQKAIFDFLKANGLNIPLKNITGLGNSTAEAKALWIADKVAEGYNDFYFADDALQNVQAVKNMLDQFDVKSKVQQAKVQFSKGINIEFNKILEQVKGIDAKKRFSAAKAAKRGTKKGKFNIFIPPSADDFNGLLYYFLGKGKQGEQHMEFFKKALINPLNRAYRELNDARQSIANDFKALKKKYPSLYKKLNKKTPDGDFTYSDAVRVYLWDKAGFDIPGLSKTDQKNLVDLIKNDSEMFNFAETLSVISKQKEGYVPAGENWLVEDIRNDLDAATNKIGRKKFFQEFIDNAEIIFSKENLNKIEAIYGSNFREALEDILYRTINGTNRNFGKNRLVNNFMNWINGSIGATMFINARSAVLQTISMVNFINWSDNNFFKAAKAFANQPQFWKDFSMIFNSNMLKQRRSGLKTDINAAELAGYVSKSKEPFKAAMSWLLSKGFLPTQIADSFAIAMGGASFYRNRIKTYIEQGYTKAEAEQKAFDDFAEIAEETQQSARPDKISQQQASPLGRLILAFQNTPMQYMRLTKKAALDLVNRRGDVKTNISKIIYYVAVQNLIFGALQSALFAIAFGDDDDKDDEFFKKKRDRVINGSIDTILRGMGIGGAVVATLKNVVRKFREEQEKPKWKQDEYAELLEALQVSPPIGIKARKLVQAKRTYVWDQDVMKEMSILDIDNPIWDAVGNTVEATTNIPLARLHNKVDNIREALNTEHEAWQRVALGLGWSSWNLGIDGIGAKKIDVIKDEIKAKKKLEKQLKNKKKKKTKFKYYYNY